MYVRTVWSEGNGLTEAPGLAEATLQGSGRNRIQCRPPSCGVAILVPHSGCPSQPWADAAHDQIRRVLTSKLFKLERGHFDLVCVSVSLWGAHP